MVREFFTSRAEGNLALHVGDDPTTVISNRNALAEALGLPTTSVKYMNQVHGNTVVRVDQNSSTPTADALISTERGLALVVLVADCLPILVKSNQVIGAIHVGRQGLVKKIIDATISQMRALDPSPITATIGPAICGNCYEVSTQMYHEVIAGEPATATDAQRHCLDLIAGAHAQFLTHNITPEIVHRCTKEDPSLFSYRANAQTGRQAGVIAW